MHPSTDIEGRNEVIRQFAARLDAEWLPSFCSAPHRRYTVDGFRWETLDGLSAHDAFWFMRAIDKRLVEHEAGVFLSPMSMAKEQIFWTGSKAVEPRPLSLWLEPVITIGALAFLHEKFSWPETNLGLQSKRRWSFDLVGYTNDLEREPLLCEVKKTDAEIEVLIEYMRCYCTRAPDSTEPSNKIRQNAYRKVQDIRIAWPEYVWVLGPAGKGAVFQIDRTDETELFEMTSVDESCLGFKSLMDRIS